MQRSLTLKVPERSWHLMLHLAAFLILAACDEKPPVVVSDDRLFENSPKPRLLTEIEPARFKDKDLRSISRPIWVKSVPRNRNSPQSEKPAIDATKTELLAGCFVADASGADGEVRVQKNGIVINPGTAMATRVDFDVRGKFGLVILHAWIVHLPKEALSNRRFGTVGVSVLIDGRPLGWSAVDRHTNQSMALDLTRAGELSVVVDNYDNLNFWDWCMIGLE